VRSQGQYVADLVPELVSSGAIRLGEQVGRCRHALQADLTRDGREALRACHQAADAIEDQMIAGLSPEDLRQLEAALHACIDALS
jgi:hypothetical protein